MFASAAHKLSNALPIGQQRASPPVQPQPKTLRRTQSRRDPQRPSLPQRRTQRVNEQLWKRMLDNPEFGMAEDDNDPSPRNFVPQFNITPRSEEHTSELQSLMR